MGILKLAMNDSRAMRRRLAKYLIPVFVLALAFNVPKFFEAEIVYFDYSEDNFTMLASDSESDFWDSPEEAENYTVPIYPFEDEGIAQRPELSPTKMRTHPLYSSYNSWSRLFVLGLIPFILLVFFNVKIYRDIQERRRRRILVNYTRPSRMMSMVATAPHTSATCLTSPIKDGRDEGPVARVDSPSMSRRRNTCGHIPQRQTVPTEQQKRANTSPKISNNDRNNCVMVVIDKPNDDNLDLEIGKVGEAEEEEETRFMPNHDESKKKTNHRSLKKAVCSVKKARRKPLCSEDKKPQFLGWLRPQNLASPVREPKIESDGHTEEVQRMSITLSPEASNSSAQSTSPPTLQVPAKASIVAKIPCPNAKNNNSSASPNGSLAPPIKSSGNRRRNEDSLAIIFMAIILIFLVCHFPRILLDIHELATIRTSNECRAEGRDPVSLWSLLVLNVSHFLLVVNSSVNMVVYCLLGSKFRAECASIARRMCANFSRNKTNGNSLRIFH